MPIEFSNCDMSGSMSDVGEIAMEATSASEGREIIKGLGGKSSLGMLAMASMMSGLAPYGSMGGPRASYSKPPSSLPAKLRNKRIKAKKQARAQRKKSR